MTNDWAQQVGRVADVSATVVAIRPVGAYHHLTLAADGIAELARPGQFVAVAVGEESGAQILRRCFSIHRVNPTGVHGPTVEIVVSAVGPGTRWLTSRPLGGRVDLIGPLGRPFPLPAEPTACVLVGGGYGSAPLPWLASVLRDAGCHVEIVLGAATEAKLFGVSESRGAADGVTVTTDDGTAGTKGWVCDVLGDLIDRTEARVVYGCGPMGMLRSMSEIAAAHDAVAQCAVEESMACGIGICWTCVMPVRGADGRTRMARSCLDGPVFRGDAIRWDAFTGGRCSVPDDAVGADAMKVH